MANQKDIIQKIDSACKNGNGVRCGFSRYAALVSRCQRFSDEEEIRERLKAGVVNMAVDSYRDSVKKNVELLGFSDGRVDYVFDISLQRTVLVYGLTRKIQKNTRDDKYHRGFPKRIGFERGHAFSHAQGGLEGGPNYFPQRATLNRGLSERGKLWRAIEMHLSSHEGLFAFVRLIYADDETDVPDFVEYGFLNGPRQFRAVIFRN